MRDSNPRPPACKADALTAAPIARPKTATSPEDARVSNRGKFKCTERGIGNTQAIWHNDLEMLGKAALSGKNGPPPFQVPCNLSPTTFETPVWLPSQIMLHAACKAVREQETLENIGLLMRQPPVQLVGGAALSSLFPAMRGLLALFTLSERRGQSGNLFKFEKTLAHTYNAVESRHSPPLQIFNASTCVSSQRLCSRSCRLDSPKCFKNSTTARRCLSSNST